MSAYLKHLAVAVVATLAVGVFPNPACAQKDPDVKALIAQLKDKDEGVRLKAAKELGKLKEKAKEAIPALTAALKDDDEDVRSVAKKSLDAIKESLGSLDKEKLLETLAPLIKDLRSTDAKKRIVALEQLGTLGSNAKEAGAAIVEYGMMSPTKSVRDAAYAAFEQIDAAVYKEVLTLLIDEASSERHSAAIRLQLMGKRAKAAIPAIKKLMVDSARPSKGGGREDAYEVFRLVALMTDIAPDDSELRSLILTAVGARDDAIGGRRGTFRHNAIAKMNELKFEPKQKYNALMSGLYATMTDSVLIIDELGRMGSDAKSALPTLMKLKFSQDKAIREAATAAIDSIKE